MRRAVGLLLISGLLFGCGETDAVHAFRVACLKDGGEWNAARLTCVESLSPTSGTKADTAIGSSASPQAGETENIAGPGTLRVSPVSATEIISRAQGLVVKISYPEGCASGVLLGKDGLILTNHHVVVGKEFLFAITDNGTMAPLKVVSVDRASDLALVKAMTTLPEAKPLTWGDDTAVGLGTTLFVLGYPLCPESVTVTRGILSGRHSIDGQRRLQTDAALNPGVSGGLAVTAEGKAIGLAVSGFAERENVGFLIPATEISLQVELLVAEAAAAETVPSPRATVTRRSTPQPRFTLTPRPRPTATPRPRSTVTPRSRPTATPSTNIRSMHTVRSGDTLSAIASRYGLNIMQLSAMNGICASDVLYVGQVLKIPWVWYDPLPMSCPTPTPAPARRSTPPPTATPTGCWRAVSTAAAHARHGWELVVQGQNENAIIELTTAICLDPTYSYAYVNRGVAYSRLGQYQRALSDETEAIRLGHPKLAVVYVNRGNNYNHLGQYQRALQDYNEAIRIDPQNANAYWGRGAAYHNLGQYQRAAQAYDEAIRLDPSNDKVREQREELRRGGY